MMSLLYYNIGWPATSNTHETVNVDPINALFKLQDPRFIFRKRHYFVQGSGNRQRLFKYKFMPYQINRLKSKLHGEMCTEMARTDLLLCSWYSNCQRHVCNTTDNRSQQRGTNKYNIWVSHQLESKKECNQNVCEFKPIYGNSLKKAELSPCLQKFRRELDSG